MGSPAWDNGRYESLISREPAMFQLTVYYSDKETLKHMSPMSSTVSFAIPTPWTPSPSVSSRVSAAGASARTSTLQTTMAI